LSYTIRDLGVLSTCTGTSCTSIAQGINVHGVIVGSSSDGSGHQHAFLYRPGGAMTDLGTLDSIPGDSHGLGINAYNDVTGDSISSDNAHPHAFRKKFNAPMEDLGTIGGVSGISFGNGINNADDVAGRSAGGSAAVDTFWYENSSSTMHDLGPGLTDLQPTFANAINNSTPPVLVGGLRGYTDPAHCLMPDGTPYIYIHAYSWAGTSSQQEVGTLPQGEEAHAYDINDDGVVVGDSSINNECVRTGPPMQGPTPHAFAAVWDPVQMTYTFTQLDAGVTWSSQSRAFGINNGPSFKVVGQWNSDPNANAFSDGFLWDSTTSSMQKLTDLIPRDSGWSGLLALAINDAGQIVGQGTYTDPVTGDVYHHAFLMTPCPGPDTAGLSGAPFLTAPISISMTSSQALPPSEAQAKVLLGATGFDLSASLAPEQEVVAARTGRTESAANALRLLPAPSAVDPLFAALGMEWTGGLAGWKA
jgi:probable HAF family extracellular repeat protein